MQCPLIPSVTYSTLIKVIKGEHVAFKDGDFVRIDYTAWRSADNKLVYTTMKKVAEESNEVDKDAAYTPQLVVMGKGNVIKGIENAIKGMSVNESKKVEVEAIDAFGAKNQELVKVMPLSDFRKRDIAPYPGMQLDLDGATATVKSVNSGRVIVDANHPLAGEKLTCEIKVLELVSGDDAKVKALAGNYRLAPDSVSVADGTAKIEFGLGVEKNAAYLVRKSDFVDAVLRYMDGIKKVDVQELYERKR